MGVVCFEGRFGLQEFIKIRSFIEDVGLSIHQLLFASNFHINIHTLTEKTNALKRMPTMRFLNIKLCCYLTTIENQNMRSLLLQFCDFVWLTCLGCFNELVCFLHGQLDHGFKKKACQVLEESSHRVSNRGFSQPFILDLCPCKRHAKINCLTEGSWLLCCCFKKASTF